MFLLGAFLVDFHVEFVVSFVFFFVYFAKQAIILVPVGKFINMYSGVGLGRYQTAIIFYNFFYLILVLLQSIKKYKQYGQKNK